MQILNLLLSIQTFSWCLISGELLRLWNLTRERKETIQKRKLKVSLAVDSVCRSISEFTQWLSDGLVSG